MPPELGAVRRLVERGHRVAVLAEESMRTEVLATGATFDAWGGSVNRPDRRPENDPLHDWDVRSPRQFVARMLDVILAGPAPGFASDLTAKMRDRRPDVVVCSFFTIGAMVAAEAAGIPYTVLMANIYGLPAPGMPPLGLGTQPATGAVSRLRDRAVNSLMRRWWNRGLKRLNAVRADYGLAPIDDFWDQVREARRVLVLTSAAFDFPAELPAGARYVGPVLDEPDWALDRPWAVPPGDDPLVLVAMSSTFQDQVSVLQRCVDALASLPVRGIVTTGLVVHPAALRSPAGVVVVESAPHSAVLAHTAVVVTHGGHGTVMRSLAAGVPMVVIPQGRDQFDNAARITSRGAGLSVSKQSTAVEIADAVRRVLDDDRYRQAADDLGATVREDARSGKLVAELEAVARQSGAGPGNRVERSNPP